MKNSLLLLLSGIGLLGCASPDVSGLSPHVTPLQEQVCCQSVDNYPWIFLQQEENIEFNIDESSPVGSFLSGKSYFSAFTFNKQSGTVSILLRSYMDNKQVIVPRVDLFDSHFQLVKTITQDGFNIVFSDAFSKNRFELKTQIDTVATPHIVIYSDSQTLGDIIAVPHPAKLRAQESGEPMPIVTDPTYASSTVGQLLLEIDTLTLSGYNQKSTVESKSETVQHVEKPKIKVHPDTQQYYNEAIQSAVIANDIPKALSLLDEAKALGIEGAQEVFVKAINAK